MGYDDRQEEAGPPLTPPTARERTKEIGAIAGAGATGVACGISVVSSLGLASGGIALAVGMGLSAAVTAVAKWRHRGR
ncbi:hypothetical protein [Streptomyces sp. ISL-11]|uniref:hypothetical protein n=1 Tax=Streptomyces sp. ISL-11 TaxID=2819174 RepID=UPI001BE9B892|nr:hypothetical protein [Streptomyces sp. ISL-11]MBT2385016.1 hypothetical protein [Streptomyces sp. ISL-11]